MIKSGDYLAANETCPNIVLHASSIEFSEPERLVLQSDAFGNAIAQWPDASEPDLALHYKKTLRRCCLSNIKGIVDPKIKSLCSFFSLFRQRLEKILPLSYPS